MKRDSRFSGVLHILLHMATEQRPLTSEMLARALETNPVVVRRLIAGLREQGYVRSEKGHGGGWTLACDLTKVTLRDVYVALGSPRVLAIGEQSGKPGCLVEQSVDAALGQVFDDAVALLLARFGEVTLADLHADVERRRASRRRSTKLEAHHG
ncbi:MAG TPA: Rrf2 family transcriptional regulator [Thermoanaerobaculia bacterium]